MPLLAFLLPFIALALLMRSRATPFEGADASAELTGDVAPIAPFTGALAPIELAGAELLQPSAIVDPFDVAPPAVKKIFELPARGEQYREAITRAEEQYGIPTSLLGRLLFQESHFRPDIINGTKRSSAGAIGIAQFMPGTARELGVDPLNADQAIAGAGRYLRQLYDRLGTWTEALAAYNWGIGNVKRKGLAAAPAETRAYVLEILNDVEV